MVTPARRIQNRMPKTPKKRGSEILAERLRKLRQLKKKKTAKKVTGKKTTKRKTTKTEPSTQEMEKILRQIIQEGKGTSAGSETTTERTEPTTTGKKRLTDRELFLEEKQKFEEKQAQKREIDIRAKLQESFKQVGAIEEAIKFRKFIMLVQNDNAFRKQVGLYTPNEMKKLKKDPKKYAEAKKIARTANARWENDSNFMKQYESKIKAIEKKFPEMARKMHYTSFFEKFVGNNFAAAWKAIGLERLTGLSLNPAELFEIPTLKQYRGFRAMRTWRERANDGLILDKLRGRIAYYQEELDKRKKAN